MSPLPLNDITGTITAICYTCGQAASACTECAVMLLIDPHTGLPADVKRYGNGDVVKVTPTAEAIARSVQRLFCDDCIELRNTRHPRLPRQETAAERHRRTQHMHL